MVALGSTTEPRVVQMAGVRLVRGPDGTLYGYGERTDVDTPSAAGVASALPVEDGIEPNRLGWPVGKLLPQRTGGRSLARRWKTP
jgi:hypothetical protein